MELKEQSEFIKVLKRSNIFSYKVKASEPGIPDIEGIRDFIVMHFESKKIDGVLSDKQKYHLKYTYPNPYIVMKILGEFHIWGEPFDIHEKETKIKFIGSIKDYLKE